MPKKYLITALVIYLLSSALSYGVFSMVGGSTKTATVTTGGEGDGESDLGRLLAIDPSEPRDQACPLNGALYTKTERDAWEQRRPLAVMIENHPEARPQSGLGDADVVFEAIAEGGVTRFMGLFYCGVQSYDTTLAPIRSARTYFIDWASGFNRPLYVHVGGANVPGPTDALGQLSEYGWVGENDLNQFSIGYPTFVRDYNRVEGKEIATEHTMVTTTEALWEVGEERGWTNMSPELQYGRRTIEAQDWKNGYDGWSFSDSASGGDTATTVAYEFWTGFEEYAVTWEYDADSGMYKRVMAGEPHVDMNSDEQIMAKNVVVLLTDEKGPINEKKHMLYTTTGTGDALIFRDGQAFEVTWSKKSRTDELTFSDGGSDFDLGRGLTWISVVDTSTEVEIN